ncbi:class I SAM-dependent methyltransferase [Aquisalinus flavus]|uniref:Methyltransferase n=1 Tax=Aquisalinus flavus TaxID=1526572 RepID=A0A8J2V706_9PROT|nr:methyltransferase domain-containing protein [Aquisalinus flavus]MBD0427225.1 class I SAM-dependent methyltransferase [Aquisalinus flavus]UNE47040.1 class I SAM-dependent methyltransferase [Aquisalinus flavus]GGC99323.1 methyltransferase [Aquisalinus flavus]
MITKPMTTRYALLGSAALLLALAACGQPADDTAETTTPAETAEVAENDTGDMAMADDTDVEMEVVSDDADTATAVDTGYAQYLSRPSRPEGDAADDASRKPATVLAFMDLMPGMTVLELEAGGGYYTELLSYAVGEDGEVIMQNPAEFDAFLGDAVTNRLADDRLANVTYSRSDFDDLEPADASVDLVTWILGPHELYFFPENKPDGFGDPAASYAEIFRVLKPGGAFVVIDHASASGDPETTGGTTHRIDPAIVIELAEAAGFQLEARSDALANPGDDYTKGVFDPAVRRNTDRFLLKFRKPA